MDEKALALAIPFFLVAIAVELLVLRAQRKDAYRFADSVTNLACGIGQVVVEPLLKAVSLVGYVWLFANARVVSVSERSPLAWLVLLFAVDLAYYAFHRASHRVNVLWASHVVHHQSEEYNLSVALRQSWVELLAQPVFYLPLAVMGFPPVMFVTMSTLNTLYQFGIHTRTVGTLGILEKVLNTPSAHRVHHGIDPAYVDKNYGGIFIVWDRLFGTYAEETTPPTYGTVKPLASWNPLWANVVFFQEMGAMARSTARFVDKLRVPFMPPEWRPRDLGGPVTIPEPGARAKYTTDAPRAHRAYVAVELLLVSAATMALLVSAAHLPMRALGSAALLVVLALVGWGALLEAKRWAAPFTLARLAVTALVVGWAFGALALGGAMALAIALGAWVVVGARPVAPAAAGVTVP